MKYLLLTLCSIFLIQCNTLQNQYFDKRYIKLKAKIIRIEEKKNIYIYYFNSKDGKGLFAKTKICNFKIDKWKSIAINKTYNLILDKPFILNSRASGTTESINGEDVWNSDMEETYYFDCINICGNKIYEIK